MKNLKKSSFTLIELVFSIVIFGIVSTAIPMLLTTVSTSYSETVKQESFYNSFSLISLVNIASWDENNLDDENNYYRVLTSSSGDAALLCTSRTAKVSQFDNGSGRICAVDSNSTTAIGENTGESVITNYDDIDDFNALSRSDFNFTGYDLNITVKYISDTANYGNSVVNYTLDTISTPANSNIKLISVNVIEDDSNEVIAVLNYFSSNTGLTSISKRDY